MSSTTAVARWAGRGFRSWRRGSTTRGFDISCAAGQSESDLLIASIGLAYDVTVVTHNAAEFSRVPRLGGEDWASS